MSDTDVVVDFQKRRELIAKETAWEYVVEPPKFASAEIAREVGRRKVKCPLCNTEPPTVGVGAASFIQYEVRGKTTGVTKEKQTFCPCWFYKNYFKKLDRDVPPHDREIQLVSLAPSPKSRMPVALQEQTIARLKADPDAGWAFFGPVGYSKTTYSVALYRDALLKVMKQKIYEKYSAPESLWRISAKELLDQFHDFAISRGKTDENGNPVEGGTKEPEVTRKKIRRAEADGIKPRLFLEEIDKTKGTKFKLDSLFDVIDGIYENQGQLVINSNLTLPEFTETFGPEFARRVAEMCNVVNFFEGAKV